MKTYEIRRAEPAELDEIMQIYAVARAFMAATGNPTQWGNGYPERTLLEQDIRKGNLYVTVRENKIRGVFYFAVELDPTYAYIEDGTWQSEEPYGVIHRIASDGSGGVFSAALDFCLDKIRHLRIDTHHDNRVMQAVVEKNDFIRRGIIYVADGSPRIAYERV